MEKILAWHFIGKDGLTSIGKLPVVVGQVQEFVGTPILCRQGLHWSINILDAVQYAQDTVLCRVEAWGNIKTEDNKGCSNFRLPLWKLDIENILHTFACDEAERAMKLVNWTDKRSWDAIEAKRKWLKAEITTQELAAFRKRAADGDAAAYAAYARAAAYAAANADAYAHAAANAAHAAYSAAYAANAADAASYAAANAAHAAAAHAAYSAAYADAYAAARAAYADAYAAADAAYAAANAARSDALEQYKQEQNARLEKRVLEAYENAN